MAGNANNEADSEKSKRKLIIIIIALLIVIVIGLVAVIAYLLGKNGKDNAADGNRPTVSDTSGREVVNSSRIVLDEESAENALEEMRREVEEGMFECSMSMEWTFQDGNAESKDAYVANSINNRHPIYFDVTLDGSDEIIYSSPVIPVGSELTNFKLDKSLNAGTYEAICKYSLLQDEENQEVISQANFIITIKILK